MDAGWLILFFEWKRYKDNCPVYPGDTFLNTVAQEIFAFPFEQFGITLKGEPEETLFSVEFKVESANPNFPSSFYLILAFTEDADRLPSTALSKGIEDGIFSALDESGHPFLVEDKDEYFKNEFQRVVDSVSHVMQKSRNTEFKEQCRYARF